MLRTTFQHQHTSINIPTNMVGSYQHGRFILTSTYQEENYTHVLYLIPAIQAIYLHCARFWQYHLWLWGRKSGDKNSLAFQHIHDSSESQFCDSCWWHIHCIMSHSANIYRTLTCSYPSLFQGWGQIFLSLCTLASHLLISFASHLLIIEK